MIHGRKRPTSAAHVESTLSLEVLHPLYELMWDKNTLDVPSEGCASVVVPSTLQSYDLCAGNSIEHRFYGSSRMSLNERFQILDNTSGARIWTRDPHTISVHVRGIFSLLHWAVPRSEHLTANVIPAIQLPETVCRGDAAELT